MYRWSIVYLKRMIQYVSYRQCIDTTDILRYNWYITIQYRALITSGIVIFSAEGFQLKSRCGLEDLLTPPLPWISIYPTPSFPYNNYSFKILILPFLIYYILTPIYFTLGSYNFKILILNPTPYICCPVQSTYNVYSML